MNYINQQYVNMAYQVVLSLNLDHRFASHERFASRAFKLYQKQIAERPVVLTYLDRALRELPKRYPDVMRLGRDAYVIKSFERSVEKDWNRERVRRTGAKNAVIFEGHIEKSAMTILSPKNVPGGLP